MKNIMRPQPVQMKNNVYLYSTPGVTYFNPIPFIQMGYTRYKVMAVGGGGGKASIASGKPNGRNMVYAHPAGGGGGGSVGCNGFLKDLPTNTLVETGAAGSYGTTDTGLGVRAQSGGEGGTSRFHTLISASGGMGSTGGLIRANGNHDISTPGDGGVGSAGGEGGTAMDSTGFWLSLSVGYIFGSGGGGYGGLGRLRGDTDDLINPQNGWAGNDNWELFRGPGRDKTTNTGGCGGGSLIHQVTGSDYTTQYGSSSGRDELDGNGVVAIRVY